MANFKIRVFLLVLGIVWLSYSQADDIDIFTGGAATGAKPNVLLVLDYSGSMSSTVTTATGDVEQIVVMREAIANFLTNNLNSMKVGYLTFSSQSSGVRWPVSDLNAHANTYDSSIPVADDRRVIDLIINAINAQSPGGSTNSVGAMVEAALYFRGEQVFMGIDSGVDPLIMEPQVWDNTTGVYSGGSLFSPSLATYFPKDAFKYDVPSGHGGSCIDYTLGGTVVPMNLKEGEPKPWEEVHNNCPVSVALTCTFVPEEYVYKVEDSGVTSEVEDYTPAYNACDYAVPHSWTGATYEKPVVGECQKNMVIMISDGQPTATITDDFPTVLSDVIGMGAASCEDITQTTVEETDPVTGALTVKTVSTGIPTSGICGPEIAKSLFDTPLDPGIASSNIETHAIGFNISASGAAFLEKLTKAGGGSYHDASNLETLNSALSTISFAALPEVESFAPMSVNVNRSTFSHDNRAFFPLFKPTSSNSWQGNLKGYFIGDGGLVDLKGDSATTSSGSQIVFSDTAQSFWSDTIDGQDVSLGGASGKIDPDTRSLYTFTGTAPSPVGYLVSDNGVNDVSIANTALTADMLGVSGDAVARDELISWIRQAPMGDPLHSKAVLVDYDGRSVAYVMTNQGVLHAIDTTLPVVSSSETIDSSGGTELFAFIPPELLPNLRFHSGRMAALDHVYGLDGQITPWHDDTNNDGVVNSGEKLLLIFGMRRGGSTYYSLDVSDPLNPAYVWNIKPDLTTFNNLAQTWSRMSVITVNHGGSPKRVLAFGGGYDAAANDSATLLAASNGNSIYIIDEYGNHLWNAFHPQMDYSIPGDLTIIDANDDGLADRIYAGDMGGNIWRVDIDDLQKTSGMSVTHLASLSQGSKTGFFYAPSVSFNRGGSVDQPYFAIAIGSGDRANPMSLGGQDRLYVVRDPDLTIGATPGYQTKKLADLYDVTDNAIQSSDPAIADAARIKLKNADGWYLNLAAGEKVLSSLTVWDGSLMATTSKPKTVASEADSACTASAMSSRYYKVSIDHGAGRLGSPESGMPEERSTAIVSSGIPNGPMVIVTPGSGDSKVMIDREIVDTVTTEIKSVFWYAH